MDFDSFSTNAHRTFEDRRLIQRMNLEMLFNYQWWWHVIIISFLYSLVYSLYTIIQTSSNYYQEDPFKIPDHTKRLATPFDTPPAPSIGARRKIYRSRQKKKATAYQQKSQGECSRPGWGLGPITPLSTVSRRFLVCSHRLRCSASAISHNGGVTRRPRDRMQAVGIWITILYGVYLYGEKCSGITVRSLRSAVPAAARKTHLERRRNRETRWRRSSRAPEACGCPWISLEIVSLFTGETFLQVIWRVIGKIMIDLCGKLN